MKNYILIFVMLFAGDLMAGNLENSKKFFDELSFEKMNLVDEFYDPNIVFQDPIHRLTGVAQMKAYYEKLYSNVTSIRFEYKSGVEKDSVVFLEWKMFLKTPAFVGGSEITVDGVSMIKFNSKGKAIEHRDYFDMGEFVYERIPVLNWIVQFIKGRMSGG